MAPLKYPIGTQSFEIIRKGGFLYADKTAYIYNLVSSGARHVFLSRPRRFGKSLLLSTFQSYFEGREDLFEGLAIGALETEWNSYPVIRLDLSAMASEDADAIERFVNNQLLDYEKKFDVHINDKVTAIGDRFGMLIKNIAEKTKKNVVVLIDEYDKGIVDILRDKEKLERNISLFRPLYAQLKSQDQYLKFVFLTGVSRFRNLTLFSSPNQLQDISMSPHYAGICGITEVELHTVFAEGIRELADNYNLTVEETEDKLKQKYDGYRFTLKPLCLYNPFSILNCMACGYFGNFWLTSGGSTKVFIEFLKHAEYDFSDIEKMLVREDTLGGPYSLKDPIPLLFQTGYLTIADYVREKYRLCIPNSEVRSALIDELTPLYLGIEKAKTDDIVDKISDMVDNGNIEGLLTLFQQIMSKIPHQNFRHNDVEHIYHLVISLICQMAGINARSEVSVAGGDIDMLIETKKFLYVFEFKKDKSAEEALRQIDTKEYALPWKADGRRVFKIGVSFSSENRNISDWTIE